MADGSSSGPVPGRRHEDPEAFDEDLEWLLVAGDAAMGARGTLGGVIAQLEHGGPFTGVPNTDIYTDQQVGLGHTSIGLVERHRWLSAAWAALPLEAAGTLVLCYRAPRAEHRGDEVTGSRSGAEAQLGRFAALAFRLTEKPADLLEACRMSSLSLAPVPGKKDDGKRDKYTKIISKEIKRAREAAVEAHKAWQVAKGEARKPRKRSERRAVLPEHRPHLPEADVE